MTVVTEARNALKNGTSTVMGTVRRGTEAAQRSIPSGVQRRVKQATRLVERPRRRRVPFWPIALTVGVAALATTTVVLVRRVVRATYAVDAEDFSEETFPGDRPEDELVTSR